MESSNPEPARSGETGLRGDTPPDREKDRIEETAREGASAAKRQAESTAEEGKRAAASAAGSTSEALQEAASSLSAQGQESLARAASTMSERLSSMADYLENRNLEDLTREARRLAHENPALFMAGGVALGLALGRFFKASPPPQGSGNSGRQL